MTPIDLITIAELIVGLFLVSTMVILFRLGKLKIATLPHILGVGAGIFGFVSLMMTSIFLRPSSDLVDYTVTNFLLSLVGGILAYVSGRMIVGGKRDGH
jgi:hypothetical protein